MHKKHKLAIAFAIPTLLLSYFIFVYIFTTDTFKSVWGDEYEITSEIKSVLETPTMERLKSVDQSGPARYLGPALPSFTRYEHSLGVWALLKKTGASLKEQIAGLLHDSSHTTFSHVSDFVFANKLGEFTQNGYQDLIHMEFLKKRVNLLKALAEFGITNDDLNPDKQEYKRLEQPLPDMCADRIQYNIHTGVLFRLISKYEAKKVFDNIEFKDGKWFFTKKHRAKKFAELSVYFTQNFWGAKWDISLYIHFANALKRALELKLITVDDLFSTDNIVMNKLTKNQDRIIQLNLQQCKEPLVKIHGKKYKTIFYKPKFRGIDPFVQNETGKLVRLSKIDPLFKNYYDSVREWCEKGYELDVLEETT